MADRRRIYLATALTAAVVLPLLWVGLEHGSPAVLYFAAALSAVPLVVTLR